MSADPNKKSGRSFQCRDVLWETFEQMARELECSVDYLINEAMKQYARQRSYGGASRTPQPAQRADSGGMPIPTHGGFNAGAPLPPPPVAQGGPPPMRGGPGGPPSQRLPPPPMRSPSLPGTPPPMRAMQPVAATPVPQRTQQMPPPVSRNPPPSRVPPPLRQQSVPTPMQQMQPQQMPQMQSQPHMQPPPMPMGNGYPAPQQATHGGMLSVVYQGEKLPVTKDRFVIGRGKQSSDLTLKDPNVSRQHAMVEFQNGVYFMVDMGSTNGVEFNGQRIARKQIGEGDSFRICDHEMRFTYR
jgi:pSer/pThr/pTyr-binding forkhead associated (FHA) protein